MARKMKNSGSPWLGQIPADWKVSRVGLHFSIILGKMLCNSQPNDGYTLEPYYCAADVHFDGVANGERKKMWFNTAEKELYRVVVGDLLVVEGGAGAGGSAIVTQQDSDTYVQNSIMIVRNKGASDNRYLRYLLEAFVKRGYIDIICNKATIPHFTKEKLSCVPLCICPGNEQKRISDYLDAQCSRIDAMLTKTRASIEEYKKLKQAVITQAVTKGVRGKREMKESGVEWIGEIPREWRTTQLRHCATIKSGITLGKSYDKNATLIERPYLRVANVQGGYVDLTDLTTLQVTPDEDMKYRLHPGDVLMTEGGDRDKLGRGCVWHGEIEPCLHQNHVFAVKTNESVLLPEFLEYLTASDIGRSYFDITAIKTTNLACTSSSKVLAFTIPLPFVEEQTEIIEYIKKRSSEINKLIMKKEQLVKELESYKKSLIYEVVTGKREV